MSKSRAELDADLYQLHASFPLWREALSTDEEFWSQYTALVGRVLRAAAPNDQQYATEQIRSILASKGIGRNEISEYTRRIVCN